MKLKSDPFKHQAEDFEASKDKVAWARLWEMGVGKTLPTLLEAAYLYLSSKIDVLIVVAPKAVAVNWVSDEIPRHLPDECNVHCHAFELPKSRTKRHQAAVDRLYEHFRARAGLTALTVSYEAIMDPGCLEVLKYLMISGRAMLVADESSYLGNNDSKRTQRMYSLGDLAVYRRILEGTPVSNSPTNIYSQMKFLDEQYWTKFGISSYDAFKAMFCVIKRSKNLTRKVPTGRRGPDGQPIMRDIMIPKLVGFQNLDKLNKMLLAGASRLTTEEAGIHLPPQVFQRLKFELAPKQRQLYETMKKEFMIELESGHFMAAPLAVSRLLRLQQIASGFLPFMDDEGDVEVVPIMPAKDNPRLERLVEHIELVPHQTIIFARFTAEIDMICDAIPGIKERCVRFDGTVGNTERQRALDAFRGGDAKFFVGHVEAAGRGLTLVNAKRTIYYSNDFKYGARAQADKRTHRIGQTETCFYDDLQAICTVDDKIITSLRNKHEVAAMVTGDVLRRWLTDENESPYPNRLDLFAREREAGRL